MAADAKNAREEQILKLALQLFGESGYQSTSLQDIADELGITRPLFYYYFKSKEDLLWRLIGHLGEELLTRARPLAASRAEPVEKLRLLLRAHTETLLGNIDAFKIYFAERHVERERNALRRRDEAAYIGLIAGVIAEGQMTSDFRDGDPRVLAMLATGLCNAVLRWYVPDGKMSPEEIAALSADVAVDGLMGSGRRRSVAPAAGEAPEPAGTGAQG